MRSVFPHFPILLVGAGIVLSAAANRSESVWQFIPAESAKKAAQPQALPVRLKPRDTGYRDAVPRWQIPCPVKLEAGRLYRISGEARIVSKRSKRPTALRIDLCTLRNNDKLKPFFSCGPVMSHEWESFSAPFEADRKAAGKNVGLFLVHGYGDGEIEIRELKVEPLPVGDSIKDYPRTGRWYAGQEADAAWRAKAEKRIELHRKGTFSIQVVDEQGQPRPDVRIVAEQQKHAYRFGTAVNATLYRWIMPEAQHDKALQAEFEYYRKKSGRTDLSFAERQAEVQRYFDTLASDFNYVVFENALKWQAWSGDWGGFRREETLGLVDWLNERDIAVKAHAFVWPGWNNSPKYLRKLGKEDPQALRRLIRAHISDMGLALRGKVATVDVLNEAFTNHAFMDLLGEGVMAEWFTQSKEVLPDAKLNVNDFLLMANGGHWNEKLDFYEDLVDRLLKMRAPLGGIGFQSHFRHSFLTAPERLWELCDRFGLFGLPLASSEFDVNLPDEKLQAAYTRDFMTAWFAHPATDAILLWGFWQDAHWLPYAGLYERDWTIKPNAQVYRDLVFEQWWSGWEETTTDEAGQANLRGFLGTYKISLYANGREQVLEAVELSKKGTSITVRL